MMALTAVSGNRKVTVPPVGGELSCSSKRLRCAAVVDDDLLINEALDGNSDAFGQLVSKYQDRLYNAVAYMLGSAEDARDVVQDAFVQAFIKLETFQRTS